MRSLHSRIPYYFSASCLYSRIPYYFSASQQYPGKFMIAYMPRKAAKYEYATVSPVGVRYRAKMFHSLNSLVRWFKEHFRDRIPGETAGRQVALIMTRYAKWSTLLFLYCLNISWKYLSVYCTISVEIVGGTTIILHHLLRRHLWF